MTMEKGRFNQLRPPIGGFPIEIETQFMVLSATLGKNNKQNMFKLILYIQVKSLVADTGFTCIYKYTINKYCIKCVSYRNKSLIYKISLDIFCFFSQSSWQCQKFLYNFINLFQIVAVILSTTGIALLAYMDGISDTRTLAGVVLGTFSISFLF